MAMVKALHQGESTSLDSQKLVNAVQLGRAGALTTSLSSASSSFQVYASTSPNSTNLFTTPSATTLATALSPPTRSPACTTLAFDLISSQYLLQGDARGNVRLFDVSSHPPLFSSPSSSSFSSSAATTASSSPSASPLSTSWTHQAHTMGVSSLAWYPVDTGLFLTGGYDGIVFAWDTTTFRPVHAFHVLRPTTATVASGGGGSVYSIACSPIASRSALVAIGSDSTGVKLFDLQSGASTHTLGGGTGTGGGVGGGGGGYTNTSSNTYGHQGSVVCVEWSPVFEYLLLSGSTDGTIRIWDIRKSGARSQLGMFNEYLTEQEMATSTNNNNNNDNAGVSHKGGVNGLHFVTTPQADPLGSTILSSGGLDGKIRCWKLCPTYTTATAIHTATTTTTTDEADDADDDIDDQGDVLLQRKTNKFIHWNTLCSYGNEISMMGSTNTSSGGHGGTSSTTATTLNSTGISSSSSSASIRSNRFVRRISLVTAASGYGYASILFHAGYKRKNLVATTRGGGGGGGSNIASADGGGGSAITAYDVETGEVLTQLRGHHGGVTSLAYRPSMQELFSCSDDGLVYKWTSTLLTGGGGEKQTLHEEREEGRRI